MNENDRNQFIIDYYAGAFSSSGLKPTFMQKLKWRLGAYYGLIFSVIGIIVLYAVINLALVGIQKLAHMDEESELKEIRLLLKDKEKKIFYYEHINETGEITDGEWDSYNKEIDAYNALTEEYNKLSEKVGTTWYLLPIPGK